MFDIEHPIPSYLTSRKNISRLVGFTALFALVFINIYDPFGAKYWLEASEYKLLLMSSLVILTGVFVVVVSRLIMFYYCKKHSLLFWQYGTWIFVEIFVMAMFYALFIKFGLKDGRILFELIKKSLQTTALIILLPYSVMWLYFSYQDKKEQIDAMTNNFFKREQAVQPQGMLPFYDEKGVLRISIKIENLLYIEASDNYVNLYYINSKQKVSRFLLRNNLKKIEPELKMQNIVRCHRSFMVNSQRVKVLRKEKDGLKIELDTPELAEIPVSKAYSENIMQILLKDNHL